MTWRNVGRKAGGGICGHGAQLCQDRDMEPQRTVLFPDACFYEFIPEEEMYRNMDDPSYVPRTVCMDEVVPGESMNLSLPC